MSSASDKRIYLQANQQNVQVAAGGDFIFLKEASRDVTVIVDGQPILMRRGGRRIVPRKNPGQAAFDSFQISNPHDVDLRLVFVVGEGDYNEMIVTGELSLSELIQTNALGTSKLPVEFTRTYGLEDSAAFSLSAGDSLWGSGDLLTTQNYKNGTFIYDGIVYFVDNVNLRSWDYEGNALATDALSFSSVNFGFIDGVDVDDTGIPWVAAENGLFKIDLYNKIVDRVNITDFHSPAVSNFGCAYHDGKIYIRGANASFWVYDIAEDDLSTVDVPGLYGALRVRAVERNHPEYGDIVWMGTGSSWTAIQLETMTIVGGSVGGWPTTVATGHIDNRRNFFVSATGSFEVEAFTTKDQDYAGKLYVQIGTDVSTKRVYNLIGDFHFLPRGAGVVLSGPIVSAILQGLDVKGGIRQNYMDYVTSLAYTDGHYEFLRKAGSASFAYRGYSDIGELYLESVATIGVLPEYLTNAI